jgi:GH18 family chitinase
MRKAIFIGFIFLGGFFVIKTVFARLENNPNKPEKISPIGESFRVNTLGTSDTKKTFTIYGYLPYWTLAEAKNLRLDLLTDISYFGLEIDSKGNFASTSTNSEGEEITLPGYSSWQTDPALKDLFTKAKGSDIHTSVTIISHIDSVSTEFLNCKECWETFYTNLKLEMLAKQIQDVNINFEYYDLVEEDTALKFTQFIDFLKKKMRKDFPEGEIVVTAFADSLINSRITHIPSISKVADKIFIMAYDFHITPNGKAAPVSPMGSEGYDIRTMIKDYLEYVPPQKLILGVPYYGFNWGEDKKVEDEDDSEVINTSLTQTYAQIMDNIESSNSEVYWDELGQVPYYEYTDPDTGKTRKVNFENERSLTVKYKIVKEFDLAGIGIWALGYDEDRPELWKVLENEFYVTSKISE